MHCLTFCFVLVAAAAAAAAAVVVVVVVARSAKQKQKTSQPPNARSDTTTNNRYEDSPLVKAVRHGWVAVVDEVDKAPVEVVCVLKGLLEDGQMRLSDGRRILCPDRFGGSGGSGSGSGGGGGGGGGGVSGVGAVVGESSDSVIWIHPDFKLVALANRPGFPFLGNDFFGARTSALLLSNQIKCACVRECVRE
jgi:hypothetical protein